MAGLLALLVSYPAVVYTVALGVVLVYWLFVVLGAVHIDTSHADGALDGALDGGDVGDVGGGHHADVGGDHGGGDVGDGGDGDAGGDHAGEGDTPGGSVNMLAALKLRSVPATVSLSFIILFAWIIAVMGMNWASHAFPSLSTALLGTAILLLAPVLALPLTSLAIRPLAPLFKHRTATRQKELVGKICVVRTGTVDDTFGEATLEDGGAGLVVRVRIDAGESLKRGEQAVIVGFDTEKDAFLVAPMSVAELDAPPKARK